MSFVTGLSGSPLPNVIAFVCSLMLLAVAVRTRAHQSACWTAFACVVLIALAIFVKNTGYYLAVSHHHLENNAVALRNYATVLFWVRAMQVIAILGTFYVLSRLEKGQQAFAITTVAVHVYAALCTSNWEQLYHSQPANQPVKFHLTIPLFWFVAPLVLAVAAIAIGIALYWRNRRQSA